MTLFEFNKLDLKATTENSVANEKWKILCVFVAYIKETLTVTDCIHECSLN